MEAGPATFKQRFFEEVDNTPLVLFRAVFGFLLAAEGYGAILTGWVERSFITPKYHFGFIAFDFLHPLPGYGMYFYFLIMGSFGLMIMLGYKYRIAAIGYFLLWSGCYLMQKTNYNNHYYLMVLLTFVLIFLPANRAFSIDAKLNPDIRSKSCYKGIFWFFIIQSAIFYMYASVAKWNSDWLAYNSVAQLFQSKSDYPLVGALLQEKWVQAAISWGGILFDFLIVPVMLWKPTRKIGLFAALFFHLFNSLVFQIGVFPYMALGLLLFFYSGEELRSFINKRWKLIGEFESKLSFQHSDFQKNLTISFFMLWFVIQVLLPVRHHFFEGDVNWTEEGHRMSWRMMLRTKDGSLNVIIVDNESGKRTLINLFDYLTPKQYTKVATHPDMLWQLVQILKEENEGKDISIYAQGRVRLNGGEAHNLYKRDYDLSKVDWDPFKHSEWIWPYPGADKVSELQITQ